MGMLKDMFKLTREAQQLKKHTPMPSMGEMVKQARTQLEAMNEQQADQNQTLTEGIPGKAIVRGMGTPARGAKWFNDVGQRRTGAAARRDQAGLISVSRSPAKPG
jgi:hypothetical protein